MQFVENKNIVMTAEMMYELVPLAFYYQNFDIFFHLYKKLYSKEPCSKLETLYENVRNFYLFPKKEKNIKDIVDHLKQSLTVQERDLETQKLSMILILHALTEYVAELTKHNGHDISIFQPFSTIAFHALQCVNALRSEITFSEALLGVLKKPCLVEGVYITDLIESGTFGDVFRLESSEPHQKVLKIFKSGHEGERQFLIEKGVYEILSQNEDSKDFVLDAKDTYFKIFGFKYKGIILEYAIEILDFLFKFKNENSDPKTNDTYFNDDRSRLKKTVVFATETARALAYLREKKILQCDVKPENIGVRYRESEWQAVVFDFGSAVYMLKGKPQNLEGFKGTKEFISPECFSEKGLSKNSSWDSLEKRDAWALGKTIYQLFCGYHLENSEIPPDNMLLSLQLDSHESMREKTADLDALFDPVCEIIGGLCVIDPSKRGAFSVALDKLEALLGAIKKDEEGFFNPSYLSVVSKQIAKDPLLVFAGLFVVWVALYFRQSK